MFGNGTRNGECPLSGQGAFSISQMDQPTNRSHIMNGGACLHVLPVTCFQYIHSRCRPGNLCATLAPRVVGTRCRRLASQKKRNVSPFPISRLPTVMTARLAP